MNDKSKAFLRKIQSKNQLKADLKRKKAEYSKVIQHADLIDEASILQNEIKAIELELMKFD